MKKITFAAALLAALCIVSASACSYARDNENEPKMVDATKLLDTRQTSVWVEGDMLGDIVIGARGSLQVIYVDKALAAAINDDFFISEWARRFAQYFGDEGRRGKALFIAQAEAFRPWEFDPQLITIGKYRLTMSDVLSPSMTNPFGSLASGDKGSFAFVVPASELKKGTEIAIGYGDDSTLWKVPK